MVTAVPLELANSTLEAEVSEGLIRVEEGLREAARAEEPLLAEASRHLIDARRQALPGHPGAAGGPVRQTRPTSGSCPPRWPSS